MIAAGVSEIAIDYQTAGLSAFVAVKGSNGSFATFMPSQGITDINLGRISSGGIMSIIGKSEGNSR
jgi:hypothetical protein